MRLVFNVVFLLCIRDSGIFNTFNYVSNYTLTF